MGIENKQADYEYGWQVFVLLLKYIAEEKGITQQEIADKTGLQRPNVARIFSCRYKPNLDVFIRIAKAVGVNFFFEDVDGTSELNEAFERAMDEIWRRGVEESS